MSMNSDGAKPYLSVRRWFRLPSRIVSAAYEAVLAGQTNEQVAETLNAQFPGLGMTGVYAASFRRSLKNAGTAVPTSREARRSQRAPHNENANS